MNETKNFIRVDPERCVVPKKNNKAAKHIGFYILYEQWGTCVALIYTLSQY